MAERPKDGHRQRSLPFRCIWTIVAEMSRSAVLSLLMALGCTSKSDPSPPDRMVEPDGAVPVAVSADASSADTSSADTSSADTSSADAFSADASPADASSADASPADASSADASVDASVDRAAGDAADPLFTDPAAPHCQFGTASLHIRGQLEGQTIDDPAYKLTYFDRQSFSLPTTVVNGQLDYSLKLTWSEPLTSDRAIPVTGAGFTVSQGQPLAGRKYCITGGLFGSPSPPPGAQGRMVFFRITGARADSCSGPEVAVALAGCAFRTISYPFDE